MDCKSCTAILMISALGAALACLSPLPANAQAAHKAQSSSAAYAGFVADRDADWGEGVLCAPPRSDSSFIAPDGTAHVNARGAGACDY
jgi:hypothetical protein